DNSARAAIGFGIEPDSRRIRITAGRRFAGYGTISRGRTAIEVSYTACYRAGAFVHDDGVASGRSVAEPGAAPIITTISRGFIRNSGILSRRRIVKVCPGVTRICCRLIIDHGATSVGVIVKDEDTAVGIVVAPHRS